jgi:hypothetical protein
MHMVTMLSVLAPAVAAAAAAAASGGFCHITVQDQLQWLSCPLAGIERGLTIGVNHVENCDRALLPGNAACTPGSFGPVRQSSTLGPFCPWFCNSFDSSMNASAYLPSTIERWGSTAKWVNASTSRMHSWGFNTVGCWSSPLFTEPQLQSKTLLYAYPLDMLVTPYEHRFDAAMPVDIWSRAFAKRCDTIAATEAAPRRGDPFLLGYWTDNEVHWSVALHPADDLLSSTLLRLSTTTSSSLANVTQWLRERYNQSLPELNSQWKTNLSSWEQLPLAIPFPQSAARSADGLAFAECVLRGLPAIFRALTHFAPEYGSIKIAHLSYLRPWGRYYSTVYHTIAAAAIRKHDPNHLIIGSRYVGIESRTVQAVIKGASASVDIVDVHV